MTMQKKTKNRKNATGRDRRDRERGAMRKHILVATAKRCSTWVTHTSRVFFLRVDLWTNLVFQMPTEKQSAGEHSEQITSRIEKKNNFQNLPANTSRIKKQFRSNLGGHRKEQDS